MLKDPTTYARELVAFMDGNSIAAIQIIATEKGRFPGMTADYVLEVIKEIAALDTEHEELENHRASIERDYP